MEVELVWLEGDLPMVTQWSIQGSMRFEEFFESLPSELSIKLRPLQACRFSRKVVAATIIEPGDQIAWLPNLQVDPQAARVARVEKLRKERWRIRSIPKK
jgi:putative ubiquitin-RnfH superfamily antitoxin RatB of RatAB toxin-antitoxin module